MPSVEDDSDLVLHERLLHSDPTAFAKIAERYLVPLVTYLTKYFGVPNLDLIETAVDDALLEYNAHPERFDPTRLSLTGYLRMSARGDLLNAWKQHKMPVNLVELDADSAEYLLEIPDERNLQDQVMIELSSVYARLRQVLGNPRDVLIAEMILDNVRATEEYAQVLGITDEPIEIQERQVKQHKDRIKTYLKRHLDIAEFQDE